MKQGLFLSRWGLVLVVIFLGCLVAFSFRDYNFWQTADRRGEALYRNGKYAQAAKTYTDPWHIGLALYRNGDFEAAAKTFARVPGADGAYNQGNAFLMHGQYALAMTSYDRALGFKPGWKEAEENKALAMARKKALEGSDENREKEAADAYEPDKIVFDSTDQKGEPVQITDGKMSDQELRATWLRGVQTTPGDFLKAKFSYQAAVINQKQAEEKK